MAAPLYQIPGQQAPSPADTAETRLASTAPAAGVAGARTVMEVLAQSQAGAVIDELEGDLVGLAPVKSRIRELQPCW